MGRSWQLIQGAVSVSRRHPKLLLFPVLIGGFTLVIAAFFMTPVIVMAIHHPPRMDAGPMQAMADYPSWVMYYSLMLYPLSMFLATFCNVAFYSQVMAALNGDPVSIRAGLTVARSRLKSILVWSLFAGLVGAIIRQIETRLGFVARIVAGFIGLAWSVSCVFAIPIIIREQPTANPLSILGKSAGTIKRTWGEMLTGYIGLGAANVLFFLLSLALLGGALALAIALGNFWILIPAGMLWLAALVIYGCVANLASQAYLCALYIYASEGVVPGPYDKDLLDQAWKIRS